MARSDFGDPASRDLWQELGVEEQEEQAEGLDALTYRISRLERRVRAVQVHDRVDLHIDTFYTRVMKERRARAVAYYTPFLPTWREIEAHLASAKLSASPPSKESQTSTTIESLVLKVRTLERQLRTDLQLYRVGASGLFIGMASLAIWVLAGSPMLLHPIFAGLVASASVGVLLMAFAVRKEERKRAKQAE